MYHKFVYVIVFLWMTFYTFVTTSLQLQIWNTLYVIHICIVKVLKFTVHALEFCYSFYLHTKATPSLQSNIEEKYNSAINHELKYSPFPNFPSSGSFLKLIPCTSVCASPPQFTAQMTLSARLGAPLSAWHTSTNSHKAANTSRAAQRNVTLLIACKVQGEKWKNEEKQKRGKTLCKD